MATTNKALVTPANGSNVNVWDTPVNANWNAIDSALGGTTNLSVTGLSGVTVLTSTQYTPPNLNITGTLTANVNYQMPTGVGGIWSVNNGTTGAFSLTISSGGAGTSVVLPQGYRTAIISDGTNILIFNTSLPTTAAGANTQVQYNGSGGFAASANFTFDGTYPNVLGMRLKGGTSGVVTFMPQANAGTYTVIWPNNNGSGTQYLTNDGAGNLSWSSITSGVSSFSGGTTGLTPNTPTGGAVVLAGTLVIANGGTGATTAQASMNALAGGVTSGQYLRGNGANVVLSAIQAGDVPTLNQNTTGSSASCTGNAATATKVNNAATFNNAGTGAASGSTFDGSAALTISYNTIGAPSTTGTGASGSWGINITGSSASCTGNAATATTAGALTTGNNYQMNSLGVNTAASGVAGEIRATNNVTSYYTSDARFKENVRVIADPIEAVRQIRGVRFDWTEQYLKDHGGADGYFNRKADIGVIAQEIQAVLPEIVGQRDDGSLGVKYDRITALLIEVVKAQQDQIDRMSHEIDLIRNELP
jgi:hypothetical protein